MSRITGLMIKKVRISETPTTNWFGTAEATPNAFFASEKTMITRGKLVIRMRSEGASDSRVKAPTIWMVTSTSCGLGSPLMLKVTPVGTDTAALVATEPSTCA